MSRLIGDTIQVRDGVGEADAEEMYLIGLWRGGNNTWDQIYPPARTARGPQAALGSGGGVGGEILHLYLQFRVSSIIEFNIIVYKW